MNSVKVSVIVPVYNVSRYLENCVNSITDQDFTDFEIILVDDCSPDNSGEICDRLAKEDGRINGNCLFIGTSSAKDIFKKA